MTAISQSLGLVRIARHRKGVQRSKESSEGEMSCDLKDSLVEDVRGSEGCCILR